MQHHLLELAAAHVQALFRDRLTPAYTYHNIQHTREVASAAEDLAEANGLGESDTLAVLLAAWFHDAGITETYVKHEHRSAELAEAFLSQHGCEERVIAVARRCILATDLAIEPASLAEQVLCDADLLHLASDEYWEHADLLRREWEVLLGHRSTDEEWIHEQLAFMRSRRFHTEAAREGYQQRLEKNIRRLEKKLRKLTGEDAVEEAETTAKEKKGKKAEKASAGKDDFLGRGDRGVETMFRTTSRNHVEFSSMVDSKANIMISINALVISVVISVLFRKLDSNPFMTIPTFVFLGVCLTTIVYAVLASRPNITSGLFTREDIEKKKANLLFFGNFYNVPVDDFEWGMKEMLKDREYLYGSMIRDFYHLGQVLGRKYHYLRISYNVFMYGFVFSILLYVLMFIFTAQEPMEFFSL